jgi:hypothetical protein
LPVQEEPNMLERITRNQLGLASFLALTGSACTNEVSDLEPGDGGAIESTEQEFSAGWGYSLHYTDYKSVPIGTSVGRTCFLQGVAGRFAPIVFDSVGLQEFGNTYEIFVNSDGAPLSAWVGCVNSAAGRTPVVTWNTGDPPIILGSTTNRQCFLTMVGSTSNGFSSPSDYVRVYKAFGAWFLGGSQSAQVQAAARCINVSGLDGGWQYGGTGVWPLAIESGGKNCFLTGIRGVLKTPDFFDGAYIRYSSFADQYFLTTKNKTAWADCAH